MSIPSEAEALAALLTAPELGGRTVQAVWLFGSLARGEASARSDVDLAVLCEPPLGLDRTAAMDQTARALGRDVDVIDLRTTSPSLAWEVLTTGRLVLERDEQATSDFLRRARFAAEDAQQRNRMIVLAQAGHVGTARR
jgi:predicted nucleotidyltransferase